MYLHRLAQAYGCYLYIRKETSDEELWPALCQGELVWTKLCLLIKPSDRVRELQKVVREADFK